LSLANVNRLGNSGVASKWAIEESTSATSGNSQLGRSGFLGKNKRLDRTIGVSWMHSEKVCNFGISFHGTT
jgi:hypothetical protein